MKHIKFAFFYLVGRVTSGTNNKQNEGFGQKLETFAKMRKLFVEKFGWLDIDGDVEHDRYDDFDETLYMLATYRGDVIAGVRVTQSRLYQSLSLSMFEDKQVKKAKTLIPDEDVLDVTRLVNEYLASGRKKLASKALTLKILKRLAHEFEESSLNFIFTVEDRFIRLLDRHKVEHRIIIQQPNMNFVMIKTDQLSQHMGSKGLRYISSKHAKAGRRE